jgi:hypothetical protein
LPPLIRWQIFKVERCSILISLKINANDYIWLCWLLVDHWDFMKKNSKRQNFGWTKNLVLAVLIQYLLKDLLCYIVACPQFWLRRAWI